MIMANLRIALLLEEDRNQTRAAAWEAEIAAWEVKKTAWMPT